MLRICGATVERDSLSRARCWCGGLFCGPGGARESTKFRRAMHVSKIANSRVEFQDLLHQIDLFDGTQAAEAWLERLNAHRPTRPRAADRKSQEVGS